MTGVEAPVAVLGGGIAGAAACIRLVRSGMQPVWIAPRQDQPFKAGEHLSAAALPLLKDLASDALLRSAMHREAYGTYSAWGSDFLTERNSIVQLEGPPNVLDRVAFEQALTRQAISIGARRIWSSVADVGIEAGCWRLAAGEDVVRADFVFDATGRKALVASKFSTRFQADQLASLYGLWRRSPDGETARPVTLIETDELGWWYLALLADQRLVVNYFSDPDLIPADMAKNGNGFEKRARDLKFIGGYLEGYGYRPDGGPRLVAANTTWLAPVIGPGWAAIGDAAASFDPLSSHGMTTALWSAIHAVDAFVSRDAEKMQTYSSNVAQGVQEFLAGRQRIYGQERRFCDSEFWRRRNNSAGPDTDSGVN